MHGDCVIAMTTKTQQDERKHEIQSVESIFKNIPVKSDDSLQLLAIT